MLTPLRLTPKTRENFHLSCRFDFISASWRCSQPRQASSGASRHRKEFGRADCMIITVQQNLGSSLLSRVLCFWRPHRKRETQSCTKIQPAKRAKRAGDQPCVHPLFYAKLLFSSATGLLTFILPSSPILLSLACSMSCHTLILSDVFIPHFNQWCW